MNAGARERNFSRPLVPFLVKNLPVPVLSFGLVYLCRTYGDQQALSVREGATPSSDAEWNCQVIDQRFICRTPNDSTPPDAGDEWDCEVVGSDLVCETSWITSSGMGEAHCSFDGSTLVCEEGTTPTADGNADGDGDGDGDGRCNLNRWPATQQARRKGRVARAKGLSCENNG
jgi:hypothetical protein